METAHSSETPSSRQRPTVDAVMLERFPSVHEQGSRELIGLMLAAVPEQAVCACIQRWFPGCRGLCPMACAIIHRFHGGPRRWDPPIKSPACISLEHVRQPPSPSRPGRLAAVSSSTWPCRPSSRPTCAPLFCALVIPGDLFARRSAIRLFSFTRVCSAARLGMPLPDPSRSDASPASQRCHKGRIRSQCRKNAIPSVERQANGLSTSGCDLQSCHFPTVMR